MTCNPIKNTYHLKNTNRFWIMLMALSITIWCSKPTFISAQCMGSPPSQNFDAATSTNYPPTLTIDCIIYSTSGGVDAYADVRAGEASSNPLFTGKSLLFYYNTSTATFAKFASTINTNNFKLASLNVEFFGHGQGTSERYNIVGYDNGTPKVTVSNLNVTTSGNYGTGSAQIVYVRSNFNTGGSNSGTLTFGSGWENIDEVRFVSTDVSFPDLWVGLDNIVFQAAVPLPVSLISFSGKKTSENENTLTWKTSEEKNFSHFEIERSSNAKSFENIGKIFANENRPNNFSTYEFIDSQPNTSPLGTGELFYRLKMIDLDGSSSFSKIIATENSLEKSSIGQFYPNPSYGKSTIEIIAKVNENWNITTFDLTGKLINTETKFLQKGINKITFEKVVQGVNFVKFEYGEISEIRKLISH